MKQNTIIKKCRITVFMLLCIHSWLFSTTLTIKQDGTGDFTTIQAGITTSADGDTVLVHPGIYYENLNMNGKNITLASLELTTSNSQYIAETVIDGQLSGSCISIHNGEITISIRGFTIQNGYGSVHWEHDGGALQIYNNSSADVTNCVMKNNRAEGGGAIYVRQGTLSLSGVVIRNNNASFGGGLTIQDNSTVLFDQNNLCSIYNNNAGQGTDIYIKNTGVVDVYVDTFSVYNPYPFFAACVDDAAYSFSIQHDWMELVAHDLYVSPDGDDANSGLSADDPLQTIAWAMRKVDADSLHHRTIHVAAGNYSNELNNQLFPIGFKPYTSIIGEDMESTILTNDFGYGVFASSRNNGVVGIENFTLHNDFWEEAGCIVYIYKTDKVIINNLTIENCENTRFIFYNEYVKSEYNNLNVKNNIADQSYAGLGLANNSGFIKHSVIFNNTSIQASPYEPVVALYVKASDDIDFSDCVIFNNSYNDTEGSIVKINNHNANEPVITFENCLFADNETESPSIVESYNHDGLTQFNNCTFTNNTAGWFTIYSLSDITMRNTIMDNHTSYEIMMEDDIYHNMIHELDVDYCNIRNGEAGIANNHGVNTIIWGEHNIEDDPGFMLTGEHPYQLAVGSPCIDAGTPDTTGMFLPPWDLLQNHRVWDGTGNGQARVDMGCYEYGAGPWVYAQPPVVPAGEYVVSNFPNPFKPSAGRGPATVISFSVPDAGEVELVIYNMRGQKVRTLMKCYSAPGSYKAQWDGRDGNHQPVASGVYFAQLITPKRTTAHKMMLLK